MNFRINGLKNTKPHETCTLCVETVSTEKINKYTNNKSPAIEQQWQQQQHRQWQFLVFTLMVTSFLRPSNHETSTSNGFYMFRFFFGASNCHNNNNAGGKRPKIKETQDPNL